MVVLELAIYLTAVMPVHGQEKMDTRKVGDYQEPLKQGDTINVTYTLINDYFEPLLNVSLQEKVPTQHLRVLQTADSDNRTLLYNATTINASWSQINPGERVDFWIAFNVTALPGTIVILEPTNVTYFLVNGLKETIRTNSLSFLVAKVNTTTTAVTTAVQFKSLGTKTLPDTVLGLMYLVPLLVMFTTYFLWRLVRRT